MFGEENLIGRSVHTIDQKSRIILPLWTKAEFGDKLQILNGLRSIKIYAYKVLEEQIMLLQDGIMQYETLIHNGTATGADMLEYNLRIRQLTQLLDSVGESSRGNEFVVDDNRRFPLGVNNLRESKLDSKKVMIIGRINHVEVLNLDYSKQK